jgi:hypothetical protein
MVSVRNIEEDIEVLQSGDDFGGETSHDCVQDKETTIDATSYP